MSKILVTVLFVGLACCPGTPCFAEAEVKPDAIFNGHDGTVSAVAFSSDGKLLASGSKDRTIILWELATGKQRAILEHHKDGVSALAFSPAGGLLASGGSNLDSDIRVWDVATGKLRRSLRGHMSTVTCIAFSPNGKQLASCASAGQGSNVKLWDVATGRLIANLPGQFGSSVAFNCDGTLLASGGGDSVILWDLRLGLKKTIFNGYTQVYGLAFSPDDRLVAVGTAKGFQLCDAKTGKKIRSIEGWTQNVRPWFSSDGEYLAVVAEHWTAKIWDVKTGKVRSILGGNLTIMDDVVFSPDGSLVAAGDGMSVNVWRNPGSKTPPPALAATAHTPLGSSVGELVNRIAKAIRPQPKSTAEQRNKDFQRFSKLGFPDIKDRKFVRVPTGCNYWIDDERTNVVEYGFLIGEMGKRFSVLTVGLVEKAYRKSRADTPAEERVGFEAADLKTHAADVLKTLRAPKADDWSSPWENELHPRSQAFVLAWICWRHGWEDLAASLYDKGLQMPKGYGKNPEERPTRPLWELVADDLARAELRRGAQAFGYPEATRSQLLKHFEDIIRRYPESEYREDARTTNVLLKQMIQEDAEHAKAITKPFEKLGKKEQIAELVFQLRNLNGTSSNIFGERFAPGIGILPGPQTSPANMLVRIGFDAVPMLIEQLDNQRFTRSTNYWHPSLNDVLRVNDCAVLILERIACRKLVGDNELAGETKRKILAWHAELQKKGERRMLIEGVTRGDHESYNQAVRLAEKYPDATLAANAGGMKAAEDSAVRDELILAAGEVKGDGALKLLLTELKSGRSMTGRLNAASVLHKQGRPEAAEEMIALWRGDQSRLNPQPHELDQEPADPNADLAKVAAFLAECRTPDAVAALQKNLHSRPAVVRMAVYRGCAEDHDIPGVRETPKEIRIAVERLFMAALDDTDKVSEMTTFAKGKQIESPRICDLVASHLRALGPFDHTASVTQRNQAILGIKNAWRKSKGLAPIAAPPPKRIADFAEPNRK